MQDNFNATLIAILLAFMFGMFYVLNMSRINLETTKQKNANKTTIASDSLVIEKKKPQSKIPCVDLGQFYIGK